MTQNDKHLVKFHTILIIYRLYLPLSYIMMRKGIDKEIAYNQSTNDCHLLLGHDKMIEEKIHILLKAELSLLP